MSGITITPANQKVPAYYLNRKFAMPYNLPKLGALADPAKSFPSLGQDNALALAALALARVETALQGAAQANDGNVAGSVAGWAAELAAARADAVKAMHAVKASVPLFRTANDIIASLTDFTTDKGAVTIQHPSSLPVDWATANVAPTANDIATTVNKGTAISLNLLSLSGMADADSKASKRHVATINLGQLNGVDTDDIDFVTNGTFEWEGVTFTMTLPGTLAAPSQAAAIAFSGAQVTYSDGEGGTVTKALSITVPNRVPTGSAINSGVALNVAINKNFKTLGAVTDPDAADVAGLFVCEFNGTPVPVAGVDVVVDTVTFHVTQAGVVTAPAQSGAHTYSGTFKVRDTDANSPATSAAINWSIPVA